MDLTEIYDIVTVVINFIQSVPAEAWAGLGAALGISTFVQIVKVKFDSFVKKYAFAISSVLAITTSVIMVMTDFISGHPTVFGASTMSIIGVMQIIYRFPIIGVKALSDTFGDARAYRVSIESKLAPGSSSTLSDQPTRPIVTEVANDLPGTLKESTFQY